MQKQLFFFILILFQFPIIGQETNNFEKPKRGIYKSFEEYKLGTPSRKTPFEVRSKERKQKGWEGTISYYPIRKDNKQTMDRLWGFSDGEIFYLKYGLDFFPIEYNDGKLSFWANGDFLK